jgi:hypothetical protein
MERKAPVRSFTLTPFSIAFIDFVAVEYDGNNSRTLNALLRKSAEDRNFIYNANPSEDQLPMRIEIVPTGNSPAPIHAHTNGQSYAETPSSGAYSIKLYNDSAKNTEMVLSVDGINTLTGEDASATQRGWVVPAHGSVTVPGWFRSHSEVAAFTFTGTGTGGSYAEKTGRGAEDSGTIAVAVFEELVVPSMPGWWTISGSGAKTKSMPTKSIFRGMGGGRSGVTYTSQVTSASMPTMSYSVTDGNITVNCSTAPPQTSDVSTGYGHKVESHSTEVAFNRASTEPAKTLLLHYATRERLISWGINVDRKPPVGKNPFAKAKGVPAPPGWPG